jgi:hypothetical protein
MGGGRIGSYLYVYFFLISDNILSEFICDNSLIFDEMQQINTTFFI